MADVRKLLAESAEQNASRDAEPVRNGGWDGAGGPELYDEEASFNGAGTEPYETFRVAHRVSEPNAAPRFFLSPRRPFRLAAARARVRRRQPPETPPTSCRTLCTAGRRWAGQGPNGIGISPPILDETAGLLAHSPKLQRRFKSATRSLPLTLFTEDTDSSCRTLPCQSNSGSRPHVRRQRARTVVRFAKSRARLTTSLLPVSGPEAAPWKRKSLHPTSQSPTPRFPSGEQRRSWFRAYSCHARTIRQLAKDGVERTEGNQHCQQ